MKEVRDLHEKTNFNRTELVYRVSCIVKTCGEWRTMDCWNARIDQASGPFATRNTTCVTKNNTCVTPAAARNNTWVRPAAARNNTSVRQAVRSPPGIPPALQGHLAQKQSPEESYSKDYASGRMAILGGGAVSNE